MRPLPQPSIHGFCHLGINLGGNFGHAFPRIAVRSKAVSPLSLCHRTLKIWYRPSPPPAQTTNHKLSRPAQAGRVGALFAVLGHSFPRARLADDAERLTGGRWNFFGNIIAVDIAARCPDLTAYGRPTPATLPAIVRWAGRRRCYSCRKFLPRCVRRVPGWRTRRLCPRDSSGPGRL